jgi:hypothetical protein
MYGRHMTMLVGSSLSAAMKWLISAAFLTASICFTGNILAADLLDQVRAYRIAHEVSIVRQLDELTRIKSVAADPVGIAAAADHLQSWVIQRGFNVAQLSAGAGTPPMVFGVMESPRAKSTVIFYAHYDGQPVTPSQWNSDPFVPVMRSGPLNSGEHKIDWMSAKGGLDPEWRLFGRAACDDKASIIAFLAAFDALKASGVHPSVNIKVVWEGEEEAGSPHLEEILHRNQSLLASDLWLIGDDLRTDPRPTRRSLWQLGAESCRDGGEFDHADARRRWQRVDPGFRRQCACAHDRRKDRDYRSATG